MLNETYESIVYTIVRIKRDMVEALASHPPHGPRGERRFYIWTDCHS
jgi:hypothetical protein